MSRRCFLCRASQLNSIAPNRTIKRILRSFSSLFAVHKKSRQKSLKLLHFFSFLLLRVPVMSVGFDETVLSFIGNACRAPHQHCSSCCNQKGNVCCFKVRSIKWSGFRVRHCATSLLIFVYFHFLISPQYVSYILTVYFCRSHPHTTSINHQYFWKFHRKLSITNCKSILPLVSPVTCICVGVYINTLKFTTS